jgi:TolB-like protein/DNA-binding winged helix-turn-helix (wHTH) protein/Tfp pilus assembly protein PilF
MEKLFSYTGREEAAVQAEPIRFADFELNVNGWELRRHGEIVKLERIPMELLFLLARNPGRLVLRSEVVEHIWGKDRFLDDSAVSTAVRKLRAALADSADQPHLIETVTGKGYRFIGRLDPAASPTVTPVTSRIVLVALPLDDLSKPAHDGSLSEGVTEELITCLGGLSPRHVAVIGRTSAAECQRRGLTLRETGRELGADFVIEGSVRPVGQSVRVSVRLLRASDEAQVWAKSYKREQHNLADWEYDLAVEIAREVLTVLAAAPLAPPPRPRPVPRAAFECHLKGRRLWDKKTPQAYLEAIALFQQAIDIDPAYALSYVGLADTWLMMGIHGLRPAEEVYPRARAAAAKALEIDAALASAHTALAEVSKGYDRNWELAEHSYQEALRLNPNYAVAHQWYANLLTILERHDEAIAEVEQARHLDPLSAPIAGFVGFTYYRARMYDDALREVLKTVDLGPPAPIVNWFLGHIHAARGEYELAQAALSAAAEETHGRPMYLAMLGYVCGRAGDRQTASDILARLRRSAQAGYVSPLDLCMVQIGLGEIGGALDYLGKAVDQRVMRVTELGMPTFDTLRGEPRFAELAAQAGLAGLEKRTAR